uniref:Uncharacterized protein n=1 Tax=Mucochytrium quahogii TaxID=96639 RepID=A0A7S2RUA7_9STRA|mmetsp:Transcript_20180/g.43657  ORF Transcript_20180/g.43657 Transcript_20180/m.43657 type:complete len:246 (+) Transcript_20180:296-1033(+)
MLTMKRELPDFTREDEQHSCKRRQWRPEIIADPTPSNNLRLHYQTQKPQGFPQLNHEGTFSTGAVNNCIVRSENNSECSNDKSPNNYEAIVDSMPGHRAFSVFMQYAQFNANGTCDTAGILSRECFEMWLRTRKELPKEPERAFHKAIHDHLRGMHGRRPFHPAVEADLLIRVRKRGKWPCFTNCRSIGGRGFRGLGFHERTNQEFIIPETPRRTAGVEVTSAPQLYSNEWDAFDSWFVDTLLEY